MELTIKIVHSAIFLLIYSLLNKKIRVMRLFNIYVISFSVLHTLKRNCDLATLPGYDYWGEYFLPTLDIIRVIGIITMFVYFMKWLCAKLKKYSQQWHANHVGEKKTLLIRWIDLDDYSYTDQYFGSTIILLVFFKLFI